MPHLKSKQSADLEMLFLQTEDGSPTLRLSEDSEAMHSLRGAFSETAYIYGSAIQTCLDRGFAPRFLSMGLGLGYVELLATALVMKKDRSLIDHVRGESFEIVPELRENFRNWLTGDGPVPAEFRKNYLDILRRTAAHVDLKPDEIHGQLAAWVLMGQWKLQDALGADTKFGSTFGCICFDAFSSKTSPDLWSEEFLANFLARAGDEQAVLSTYACTGALKRALKAADFEVTIREGFSSKRDSTYAIRSRAN